MKEIIIDAFSAVNLIPSTLLLFAAGYWLIVLFGLIDMDTIDIDADIDADVDIDVDADVDADVEAESSESFSENVSWLNNVLIFFNLHHLPFMIFYSVLALVMWLLNMAVTHYLSITIFSFSLAVLVPVFVVSLLVAKFVTAPIARIFASVEKNHEITNPIGKICEVQLTVRPGKLGQGIVTDLNGNVVRLNIVGQNQTIDKGTRTLVIEYQPQAKAYLVEPYNN